MTSEMFFDASGHAKFCWRAPERSTRSSRFNLPHLGGAARRFTVIGLELRKRDSNAFADGPARACGCFGCTAAIFHAQISSSNSVNAVFSEFSFGHETGPRNRVAKIR